MLANPFNFFRLLVPATDITPSGAPRVDLEGTTWTMTDDMTMVDGNDPEYTCISYSWGSGRTANPIVSGQLMSDRVIPVIEATIRALHPTAIWIDAFCIPDQEPARTACLRSMGALYASAACVVVVLSKPCYALLGEVARMKGLDEAGLLLLEHDDWVSRAWTYQELVNSKRFCFAAEGGSSTLDGMQFLSEIGNALQNYRKLHGCDSFMLRTLHPRLDNLEDTIADWLTADISKRSAYQAMSSMDRRTAEMPDDCFNALIGAISAEPFSNRYETTLHPAEYFMQLCEEKGDFSFIYSSAPRSKVPGRSWRPLAGPIPAIQPWHTFGDGQLGTIDSKYLKLHNMCRMNRGPISLTADQFITKWLQSSSGDPTTRNTLSQILTRLRQAGFAGCGDFIELEEGFFYLLSRNNSIDGVVVYVAAGVRWPHGGPGVLATRDVTGLNHFCDVGVFVGPVPKAGDVIDLV